MRLGSTLLLTALAGVAVLGEPLSLRLALAALSILGGIALVLRPPRRRLAAATASLR